MGIYIVLLTSAFIFNYIECSSHSERNRYSGRDSALSSSRAAGKQHTPDQTSTDEHTPRARSRSPASSPSSINVLGHPIRELGYLRLIPRSNQHLRYEFRNYVMPAGTPICWRGDGKTFSNVPAREHIVLSASNGDFSAILSYGGYFLGIFRRQKGNLRAKMNMMSGKIENLTPDEIRDCPVGKRHPIFPQSFIKAYSNRDSLQSRWNHQGEHDPGSSPSVRPYLPDQSCPPEEPLIRERSESPPIRPPSDQVLGYTMEQLGFVRLIPCNNQNQQFEFRRYIFPTDKTIRSRIDCMSYAFERNTEYIVVSTSNGDVFAVLDHSGTLYGIYRGDRNHSRIKINMISGVVEEMTRNERTDCPVGRNRVIFPNSFNRALADFNSLQIHHNPDRQNDPGSSSSARQHSAHQTSPQWSALEFRSRSPPGRPPSDEVLGYQLPQLGFLRLIPRNNPTRQFEFRRYVFNANGNVRVMTETNRYVPVSTREHIVLSTSTGDVFAILEYTGILRGIYQGKRDYSRIRINMISGQIDNMTSFEMKECHVGKTYPIFPRWFDKVVSNEDSLQYLYN